MTGRFLLGMIALGLLGLVAGGDPAAPSTGPAGIGKIDFIRQVRPILARCFPCHGADEDRREGGLRLDQREAATTEAESGAIAIVPGQASKSELLRRLTTDNRTRRMPPKGKGEGLSPAEIALLRQWIEQGADYSRHWAFVKPARGTPPTPRDPAWRRNPIDQFIRVRLEQEGLPPAGPADPYALIRRVSLDLRGLPPTPAEVDAFLKDASPNAYERLVDRLLADPAYGERWARMWLDLARYADSAGYGSDPLRPQLYRFRDWVIEAFNANLPYDQFTLEQLAGDLLPKPTHEQRIATAFHRNTMTNTEGGTDDEEFRSAAIKDRTDVTFQVWMGLTMGCAKCHNHKYDPLPLKEYYQAYAIFNQTEDADRGDEYPTLPSYAPAERAQVAAVDRQIAALAAQLNQPSPWLAAEQRAWEASLQTNGQWLALQPTQARSQQNAGVQLLGDRSVLVGGLRPGKDVYTVTASAPVESLTALRLEAIPDPSLPGQGSGREDAKGNFILSRITLRYAHPDELKKPGIAGRFVRLELPGKQRTLHLAEVEIFSAGQNVARRQKATQSSTDFNANAERAIDGKTDGRFFEVNSVTHNRTEDNPWWEVDLGAAQTIDRIVVWNRTDGNLEDRLQGYRVLVLDDRRQLVRALTPPEVPRPSQTLTFDGWRTARWVSAAADFTQPGLNVRDVIASKTDPKKGWGVGTQERRPHQAVFVLDQPLKLKPGTMLETRLEHQSPHAGLTLGRFRLSVTGDTALPRRAAAPPAILAMIDKPSAARTPSELDRLAHYFRGIAPATQKLRDEIAKLESTKPKATAVPVMRELPADRRRPNHILIKGNFLQKGEAVTPAVPTAFHALPADVPANRLGLARWIVQRDNPLTARVAVNRFWARLFGKGIVESEEDHGIQGELPSHPELLDWLAVEFMDTGWDVKRLLKLIVTSATYRQSATVTKAQLDRDPRNRLLCRSPRVRLEAEMVRDQALALSGLLSRKMFGPSVYPYQPPGLWQAAFNGERSWTTSTGADKYRRGVYVFWRRTVPYPSLATFDAPSRELCAVRRPNTNTPLQAFVTLNDVAYVECAQGLARRILREGGKTDAERLRFGLRLCLVRPAKAAQVATLQSLLDQERERYGKDSASATALATEPFGPLPAGIPPAEAAAWTVVANVLLNLDGVLTKG